MVSDFPSFPKKNGKSAKEENAARHFRPEIWLPFVDGTKLAPFGRSDNRPVRALRFAQSLPFGAGLQWNRRGSCTSVQLISCMKGGLHVRCGCFAHRGAGPHPNKIFSAQAMRIHVGSPYVSLIYDSFYFRNAIPWSLHFLSVPGGKKTKQKKGQPPHHSGLKISLVTTLRRARSLCSLRQALWLTPPAKFSPFGHRPPFKGAGMLHQCWTCIVHEGRASFSMQAFLAHGCGTT